MAKSKKQKNAQKLDPAKSAASDIVLQTTGPSHDGPWYLTDRFLMSVVLAVTALVFLNSLSGQFLYDDWYQIERNPSIRSWSFLSSVFTQHVWQFANSENMSVGGLYYRPFFNLTLLINYQLFGLGVTGWHGVSVILHLAATAMVFVLARLWTLGRVAAIVAALIFGLHPIHVESVAWASALPDLLLGVFVLGCLVLYEKYRQSNKEKWPLLAASIVFAILAAGVKETGIILPLFLLIREAIDRSPKTGATGFIKANAFRIGLFGAVALLYLAARYAVLGFITKTNPLAAEYSLLQSIYTIPYIMIEYLRMLFIGYPLSFIYDFEFVTSPADTRFWISSILLSVFVFFTFRYSISRPGALKALALFTVFLIPVLNLRAFSPIESIAHDRYLYLPSAGFIILGGFAVQSLANRLTMGSRKILLGACLALCMVFGVMTVFQNQKWSSDTILTEHALTIAPNWPFLHLHLGEVYADDGRLEEAENEFKKAIEAAPEWAVTYSLLANLYLKQGRTQDSETAFRTAISLGATGLTTSNNFAASYIQQGRIAEAKEILKRAIAQNPDNSTVNYNWGLISERESNLAVAEQHFLKAIAKDPSYVEPRVALAALLVRQNRLPQALEQISAVRNIDPNNSEILFSLAGAFLQSKQCSQALEPLDRLTRLQPTSPRVFVMLGLTYKCLEQTENARASFRRAIEVGPNDPIADVARRNLEQP